MEHSIEYVLEKYNCVIEGVCRRYHSKCYSLDWEDLAQECRIRIYLKWNTIKTLQPNNMKALIATVCKNCCLNIIRDTIKQSPEDTVSIETLRGRNECS
jgi:DNA-directed RNA polymerase specialized sigma24 family protein